MSETVIVTMISGFIILGLGVIALTGFRMWLKAQPPAPVYDDEDEDDEPEEPEESLGTEEKVQQALPVDPNNPPSWKVYSPKPDSPSRHCVCHPERALEPGQRILWWPVPNSNGAVNVYCEEGIEVPQ